MKFWKPEVANYLSHFKPKYCEAIFFHGISVNWAIICHHNWIVIIGFLFVWGFYRKNVFGAFVGLLSFELVYHNELNLCRKKMFAVCLFVSYVCQIQTDKGWVYFQFDGIDSN